jgi:hypothetical protein
MGLVVREDRTFGPWRGRGEVGRFEHDLPVGDDLSILFDRIGTLLDSPRGGPASRTDEVENTLTDGYARALALEGDRLRTEERIKELAGSAEHVSELQALKIHLSGLDRELDELRGLLKVLAATL